jgi:AcrR family transcriptional regulator
MHPVILSAATQLFAQKGLDQPTMDEVAAAAGVQKATLYAYFDGKSALVDAVIDKLLQELPVLRLADDALTLREQLVDVGLQLQELAAHSATVSLIFGFTGQRLSAKQLTVWEKRHEEFERFLAGLLKHHCDCEQPKPVAQLFLLLVAGDLRQESVTERIVDMSRIQSAVDLILRAYPMRSSSTTGRT